MGNKQTYGFDKGDMVRIVGTDCILKVSKHWLGDDDVILESPNGQLITIDYKGVDLAEEALRSVETKPEAVAVSATTTNPSSPHESVSIQRLQSFKARHSFDPNGLAGKPYEPESLTAEDGDVENVVKEFARDPQMLRLSPGANCHHQACRGVRFGHRSRDGEVQALKAEIAVLRMNAEMEALSNTRSIFGGQEIVQRNIKLTSKLERMELALREIEAKEGMCIFGSADTSGDPDVAFRQGSAYSNNECAEIARQALKDEDGK